ncbi:putative disease resistance protein RGA4 [Capsicum annuum]|uniref:putative disease resistance protein RGA4 n=1 Tax=Capsicum annuum TaxID=4072 RepID=UPI001FB19F9D|nr:putative disease resistance protein RGA4 [Capsicum annuum]
MLDGKKYLLVLDDVWNEDTLKWSNLKNMLISGAKERKILVTTRSDMVEEVSGSVHQHKLGDLSNEDSWTLFEKWAFESNKENKNSNLVEIGKEIVRKCRGVILVIRFDLIDMWITQGFIQSITSYTYNTEDVAYSYFMDLLRRSFFKEDELFPHLYKMHDLVHDLAKEVIYGEFFSIIKEKDTVILPDQTLHASCLFKIDDSLAFPNSFYKKHRKLQTFIYVYEESLYSVMSNSTLERMISNFTHLRILHLRHMQIEFLPQSLGGLKHLRYLAIFSCNIVSLPNSITKLHNLLILKLTNCITLKNLPRDIWRLVSLRHLICKGCKSLTHIPPGLWQFPSLMHLDFTNCSFLEDMPPGIGQLTSLWTLTSFIIGKESCMSGLASDKLNGLKDLVDLRNSLHINFRGLAHAIGDRIPTNIVKIMKHLRKLTVAFNEYGIHEDLIKLEALQPHQNIEILEIVNYSGSRFPSWLMVENLGFLLPKLVYLYIKDCHICKKIPPL